MKYCPRFYHHLDLGDDAGGMSFCPWIQPEYACIGNLNYDTVEEAVHSEPADLLRASMDDQTFQYCSSKLCPFLQNHTLEELSLEEYERKKCVSSVPDEIELSCDFFHNQSYEACRDAASLPSVGCAEKIHVIYKTILPILNQARHVSISGGGWEWDPLTSCYMMELLENLHPSSPDFQLLLETNGVFFDEAHWKRIGHLSRFPVEIAVTVNSFDEFIHTYLSSAEHFRYGVPFGYRHTARGGNYQKMLSGLEFMARLRAEKKISCLTGLLVMQDRNFAEIPAIIKRCFDMYAFDRMILRPVSHSSAEKEDVYWFRDIRNPLHPYHMEYLQIMENEVMKDPRVQICGKTVTKPCPYPKNEERQPDFLFPYEAVRRGSRVVIYGAGEVGKKIVQMINEYSYCSDILWIDQQFNNESIQSPNRLLNLPHNHYDFVILATANSFFELEMRSNLRDMGIPDRQVLSCRRKGRITPMSWDYQSTRKSWRLSVNEDEAYKDCSPVIG